MTKQYDVIIVGAGVAGLSLAVALGEKKLKVALLDAREFSEPNPGEHVRVSAINHVSEKILTSLGVWQLLPENTLSPFRKISVWDANGGGEIQFDSTESAQAYLGHIVPNHEMQRALLSRIKQLNTVDLKCPVEIKAVEVLEDKVDVKLPTCVLSAKLLVGADGANSWVREQCGFECELSPYNQVAVIATVKTEKRHAQVARQCFQKNGPLAFLPLRDLNTSSIVWATTQEESEKLLKLDENVFLESLTNAFENKLGKVTDRLDAPKKFPLIMRHAKEYCKPRIALVGDAAHTIHPLAGQGLNMGILDVACLAEVVSEISAEDRDIGRMNYLRVYERWRRGDNAMMIATMSGFRNLFGSQIDWLADIRSAGMDLVNNIPFLKNQFMRYAMGDRIRLPAMVK